MATLPTPPRMIELDALRGFAVMAILLMNIIAFAMPEMAYMSPAVYGGTAAPDLIAWTCNFLFVDGKMRGLFTLLFGASLILIVERAAQKGESPARVHFARMSWLALFGLAHFFLLWFGDILFLYAVVGCVAYWMRDWEPEILLKRALLLYAIGFIAFTAAFGSMLWLQYGAGQPGASDELIAEYRILVADMGVDDMAIAEQLALYRSGFGTILQYKLTESWTAPLVQVAMTFLETLPLMMFGMALFKNGFLAGQWELEDYRNSATRLTLIGFLLMLPILAICFWRDFDILVMLNATMPWSKPSLLLMTLGYAAALILLVRRFAQSLWIARVAAAGRAAFTNYIGTSIVMCAIFYGWGLGLYGHIGRAELYLFVLGAWIAMLGWSQPWLARYRYGPFEWLWRSLARRRLQPMRK